MSIFFLYIFRIIKRSYIYFRNEKMLLIFKALNTLYPHHTKAIKFMYKRVQLAKRRKSKHSDIDISMYVFFNEQCSAYKLKEQAHIVFSHYEGMWAQVFRE